MAPRSKQERLPGTEGAIEELESLSHEYAATRDARMELLRKEVELKTKLREAMHSHDLTKYIYQDICIELVPGEEKLKVVVARDGGSDCDGSEDES